MSTTPSSPNKNYFEELLTIMCSEHPTFSDVLNLFTSEPYYRSDHYILLAKPKVVTYYYALCCDTSINQKVQPSLVPSLGGVLNFDPPCELNGIHGVKEVRCFEVNSSVVLLLINPSQNDKDHKNGFDHQIINFTINALQSLYTSVEVDVPYTVRSVIEMSEASLKLVSKRSFSVINYHPAELFQNLLALFVRSGISTKVHIVSEDLLRFFVILRRHYNDVPYHNWFHALDVTQFVFSVIQTVNLHNYLTDYEIFGLLLSAICHDTDHNGMNNTFHRNAQTLFAHLAPNLPPLEHHHSCITMDLSREILKPIEETERKALCHFIINCIMATDMEQHKGFLEEFKKIQEGFQQSESSHRQLLAQIVLKAADLSNTVRDFDEAARMATKLSEETHRQGDEEKKLGLKVSPMCNRDDQIPLCKGQIGFYNFVARPLMKELHDFFPVLAENERQFLDNFNRWEKMTNEIEQTK